jgi:hypothetical protein
MITGQQQSDSAEAINNIRRNKLILRVVSRANPDCCGKENYLTS